MVSCKLKIILLMLFFVVFAATLCSQAEDGSYYSITGPCNLTFPGDHGPHPGYRTEWWYYTGNLRSERGDDYGFQLTFFRRQISSPGADRDWPEPASAWRTRQIFLAHAALTDVAKKRFHHAEQVSRETTGLAGARHEGGRTSIMVKTWTMSLGGNEHILEVNAEGFALKLKLSAQKAPILHGEAGYSRKGTNPASASCYYSLTRLEAEGSVSLDGTSIPVVGTAWMDHEFSSAPLEPDLEGWDWFSLQLSNNTELMIYLLRKKDGTYSELSSGTFVDASGKTSALDRRDFKLAILDHWKSPRTGATYPSGWHLEIHPLQVDLHITPKLTEQEQETPETTNITYWEGCVSLEGDFAGGKISGQGYAELTGYAGAMGR
jgi:predicted secreted hydrolase